MKTFKKTLKLLNVAAENKVQFFEVDNITLTNPAVQLLNPLLAVIFDRVVLFQDKAIVQGRIHKNIIYKAADGLIRHQPYDKTFSKEVELPGFNPGITIGRFNRRIMSNNIIDIGPGNHGIQDGIDVQIYITRFVVEQILLPPIPSTTLDEKLILDFILKISKFTQQALDFPAPPPVFECRNVRDCFRDC